MHWTEQNKQLLCGQKSQNPLRDYIENATQYLIYLDYNKNAKKTNMFLRRLHHDEEYLQYNSNKNNVRVMSKG